MGANKKIAIFVSFSGKGGVERMMLNLAGGIAAAGHRVDLLPIKSGTFQAGNPVDGVHVVDLGASHTLSSLPGLVRYLKTERPDALLAAKDRANRIAIVARKLTGVPTRIVVRMGTTVSASLAEDGFFKRWAWFLTMRWVYPFADGVVAVSRGVAQDMARITRLPMERLRVVPNPVVSSRLYEMADASPPHPWFEDDGPPVIVGIGRLTRQKDFPTLIRAFARLQEKMACRLIILGEGRDRPVLKALATELGVRDRVALPGFADNPYAYLGRADLFVLSSVWEGSPNVLTEAMALGIPVVATDCPSGPREVLEGGRVAPLVPMEDPWVMAEAMERVLIAPPDADILKAAVSRFTVESSAREYLKILIPDTPAT